MSCPACDGVEGAQHTCAGSGVFLAEEAYGADEVELPVELARFGVRIELVARGLDEKQVREHLTPMVAGLLDDDLIDWIDFSVEPR